MRRESTPLEYGLVLLVSLLFMPCSLSTFFHSADLPPLAVKLMVGLLAAFGLPLLWNILSKGMVYVRYLYREQRKHIEHRQLIDRINRVYQLELQAYRQEQRLNAFRSRQDLWAMTPKQFEQHIALVFGQMGYRTKVVGRAGDRGVDIEARRGGEYAVVQCKRYRQGSKVGSPAVRGFVGAVTISGADRGFLVTTSSFTEPARLDADSSPAVTLVDGPGIVDWWKQCRIGPYKTLRPPHQPSYPPAPTRRTPPHLPALTVLGFTSWQWVILMVLTEAAVGLWSFLAGLLPL